MKKFLKFFLCLLALAPVFGLKAEKPADHFPYSLRLHSVRIENLPGLHSFAHAQHQGHWLIIGGRRDGLHARQPFNAFQPEFNNDSIYVVNVPDDIFYSASLEDLPESISEQMQSTNMNFYQYGDYLYIIGGYAYSSSQNQFITFPYLTEVNLPALLQAVINNGPLDACFRQITDDYFAVAGGQMGKMQDVFYLVGGHRFDGMYNPFGNPTYTQNYTHEVRRFLIDSSDQLSFTALEPFFDELHLRRRDYNLISQIFPDGSYGYSISAGVFQEQADLPFLYPVDIKAGGIEAHTSFNQYLSHYHGAKVSLYDGQGKQNHTLFFGGMSQYYYEEGELIQDDRVPFVKTVSRLSRYEDNSFAEFAMQAEMPALQGASSEFLINTQLPMHESRIIYLDSLQGDSLLLGHIYGGIFSPDLNPFTFNQTQRTHADSSIFAVYLIPESTVGMSEINGGSPFYFRAFPNPAYQYIDLKIETPSAGSLYFFLSDANGRILRRGTLGVSRGGIETQRIDLSDLPSSAWVSLSLVYDKRYYMSEKILIHPR